MGLILILEVKKIRISDILKRNEMKGILMSEESIYDDNGNIKIPAETIIEKLSMELARKNLEITQLQTAVEILQKELDHLGFNKMELKGKGV